MSTSAMVTLSVSESTFFATNSLPELLAFLFEVRRAQAKLDVIDEAIAEALAECVACEGNVEVTSKYIPCGRSQESST